MSKKKETITPLHDRVVVEPQEAKSVTKGGIIIPDTAKEKPLEGTVFEVGKGKKDEPLTVKKGDKVLYITTGEFSGNVCNVLKASDYEIIFQGSDGREDRLIRCRHYEDEVSDREEIVSISHHLTDELKEGKLFIGLDKNNSKSLKEYYG